MFYKIDLRYFDGWDDAGWTDGDDDGSTPTRFQSVEEAQAALDEFFEAVKVAVVAGDMDMEETHENYRIVEAL